MVLSLDEFKTNSLVGSVQGVYREGSFVSRVSGSSCVSKIEMSPLTATLKCPHGRGKDTDESEAVTEVSGDGFG
jgi:hypothetical protein